MHPSKDSESHAAAAGMVHTINDRGLRILIVDDEDSFRKSMKFLLSRKYGATVAEVCSGTEAIEMLASGKKFDLILVDLVMPGMGGMETCAQLEKIDTGCPIVIMSAYSDSKGSEEAGKQDVIVLSKPIPRETMTQLLFDAATHEASNRDRGSDTVHDGLVRRAEKC